MWTGRPLKAGGLHSLIKSHINHWHFPELRLKQMGGSLSSHVLPGVLVARRQGGHGLIACFILFFSNGFLICPKNILRVQLLQSLGKNASWNQDHLFKERDSSKPDKFKDEVSATDIQELESTTSVCMPFLLKADCYFYNVHTNHPDQP